jgi:hypothetical protein
MLENFIVLSFAVFMAWQVIRYLTPIEIPERLAPFILLITSLLFALPFSFSWVLAFAASGGVAVINVLTKAEGIAPLHFSRKSREKEKRESRKIYLPDLDG